MTTFTTPERNLRILSSDWTDPARARTERHRALADEEASDFWRGTDRRVEEVPVELRGVWDE